MTEHTTATELNTAQKLIYSRTNIRRAFQDFDESDIAGLYKSDSNLLVVRTDGTQQLLPEQPIKDSYLSFSGRLKNFFAYLGPNYRGPSIWHHGAYIILKGWNYASQLSHKTPPALMQTRWIDKFSSIQDQEKLLALLQGDQTDLGHLVAPDGMRYSMPGASLNRLGDAEENDDSVAEDNDIHEPWCSCGSYQYQLNNLAEFQAEIEGFKPTCIHLSWFQRYRQLLVKRSALRSTQRGQTAQKATAWAYAPPEEGQRDGKFMIIYTTQGSMAPLNCWKVYKPKETFTQDDAWDLFDSMLDNEFVPFPAFALPQVNHIFTKKNG